MPRRAVFQVHPDIAQACAGLMAAALKTTIHCPRDMLQVLRRELSASGGAWLELADSASDDRVAYEDGTATVSAWLLSGGSGTLRDYFARKPERNWYHYPYEASAQDRARERHHFLVVRCASDSASRRSRDLALVFVDPENIGPVHRPGLNYSVYAVAALVDAWAGTVSSQRTAVSEAAALLQRQPANNQIRDTCCEAIDRALREFPRTVGVTGILHALRRRMPCSPEPRPAFSVDELVDALRPCWSCPVHSTGLCGKPFSRDWARGANIMRREADCVQSSTAHLRSAWISEQETLWSSNWQRVFEHLIRWAPLGGISVGETRLLRGRGRTDLTKGQVVTDGSLGGFSSETLRAFTGFGEDARDLSALALATVDPLRLDQQALLRFFFGRALSPNNTNRTESGLFVLFPESSLPSDEELAEALDGVTTCAYHVFSDSPLDECRATRQSAE